MRKWTIAGVSALLLLIAAAAVTIPFLTSRAKRALTARHAAIRAQGLPVDLAELDEWYPQVSTVENGAAYVEAAIAREKAVKYVGGDALPLGLRSDPLPLSGPLPPAMEEAIVAALAQHEQTLPLYRTAAQKKQSRYSIELIPGTLAPLEHLSKVRLGAWLLGLETLLRIERGETDKAVEGVEAVLGISETLGQEPMSASQLARLDIQTEIALPVLARLLGRMTLSDAQLARLAEALHAAETLDCFYRGVAGDRCVWDAYTDAYSRQDPGMAVERLLGIVTRQQLEYLEKADRFLQAAQAPVEERYELARQSADPTIDPARYGALVSWPLATSLRMGGSEIVAASVRYATCMRCARTALAIERYRLAHGTPPERLEDLVPAFLEAVPVDPFTRASLAYRRDEGGYVVYSLGADVEDDGGVAPQNAPDENPNPYKWDHPFRVERVTGGNPP